MITEQTKIIKKFELMSQKYHKLSLLFYELSQSLRIEARKKGSLKEFKAYLKTLSLDCEAIKKLSVGFFDLNLNDLKKNG